MFEARRSELPARDPSSRFGHNAALQYLVATWSGSHEDMYAFAHEAAAGAPAKIPLAPPVSQTQAE